MADDDILHAQVLQHIGGNLAGEGAGLLVEHVLCADGDADVLEGLDGGGNVDGGNAYHDIAPLALGMMALSSSANFFVSEAVLFIFQLPAMMVLRYLRFMLISPLLSYVSI